MISLYNFRLSFALFYLDMAEQTLTSAELEDADQLVVLDKLGTIKHMVAAKASPQPHEDARSGAGG